jgi:hypothetical protein
MEELSFFLVVYLCVISLTLGVSGMVRQGLNHLAIPQGWMWGGSASEHCPVWCEVYTEPVLAEKVLPNGTHYPE